MKILSQLKYYTGMALFILSKIRLAEIQAYEKELETLLEGTGGFIGDAIYDSLYTPTREGWNEALQKLHIDVDWKGTITNNEPEKSTTESN